MRLHSIMSPSVLPLLVLTLAVSGCSDDGETDPVMPGPSGSNTAVVPTGPSTVNPTTVAPSPTTPGTVAPSPSTVGPTGPVGATGPTTVAPTGQTGSMVGPTGATGPAVAPTGATGPMTGATGPMPAPTSSDTDSTSTTDTTTSDASDDTMTSADSDTSDGADTSDEPDTSDDTGMEPPGDDEFLENRGEDCEVGAITGASNSKLPDPFTKLDGSRVTTKEDWRCRRQEIVKTVEEQIYGWKGPKPDSVTGSVSATRIEVTVSYGGREVSFSAGVNVPAGAGGGAPAIVVLGGFGGVSGQILSSEGVASISYSPTDIGAESGTSRAKNGHFFSLYGQEVGSSGTLVAWAWGVSRIIDVIEQSDQSILRADGIAVTGCSRFGKGAFSIGAFDERIALTIPIESGSGGVPIWRGVTSGGAQPPDSAYGEQPWLGDGFGSFRSAVNNLAADQHEVVGMVAPRGLLILDNPHIDWLGARAGHISAQAGAEIYKALGAEDNIGYHSAVQDGTHCAWRSEWDTPTHNAIRKHLKKEEADGLTINASGQASGNLGDLKDWETPTLQ